jgi:hypothetical protein
MKMVKRLSRLGFTIACAGIFAAAGCRSPQTQTAGAPATLSQITQSKPAQTPKSEVTAAGATTSAETTGLVPASYVTTSVFDGGACSH